jgi:hypothetical protein
MRVTSLALSYFNKFPDLHSIKQNISFLSKRRVFWSLGISQFVLSELIVLLNLSSVSSYLNVHTNTTLLLTIKELMPFLNTCNHRVITSHLTHHLVTSCFGLTWPSSGVHTVAKIVVLSSYYVGRERVVILNFRIFKIFKIIIKLLIQVRNFSKRLYTCGTWNPVARRDNHIERASLS